MFMGSSREKLCTNRETEKRTTGTKGQTEKKTNGWKVIHKSLSSSYILHTSLESINITIIK